MTAAEALAIITPKTGRRAVVLCDGVPPSAALLAAGLVKADLFVCADAAGRPHDRLPRRPDAVIGDFDTLGPPPADDGLRYLHDLDQDTTDAEKALEFALAEGCDEAVLLGAGGGHLDHVLANCALLERFAGRLDVALADDFGVTLRVGAGRDRAWQMPPGSTLSLNALGRGAAGVRLSGVSWPLDGAELAWGGRTAVSNRVVASPVRLSCTLGALLVTLRVDPDVGPTGTADPSP